MVVTPSAYSPASIRADFTWALATGDTYSMPERVRADYGQRSTVASGTAEDRRPHPAQRLEHPLHRAVAQVTVAGENGKEPLPGQKAGHQSHRGAGVAAIQDVGGLRQTVQAFSFDGERFSVVLNGNPHGTERVQGGEVVLSPQETPHRGDAAGDGAEHDGTVGDGFVSRHRNLTLYRCSGLDGIALHSNSLHYSQFLILNF